MYDGRDRREKWDPAEYLRKGVKVPIIEGRKIRTWRVASEQAQRVAYASFLG